MVQAALDWLRRPIAHRGLHDERNGLIENSASAIEAAIAAGYGVEVDLQCSADHHPAVFHDATLDRLTQERGALRDRDLTALCAIPLSGCPDCILSLSDLLALVDGRVPLLLEIKTHWDGDRRFEANIAACLQPYRGKVAVMSFDPGCMRAFRRLNPSLPRGLISGRFANRNYWWNLSPWQRFAMRNLLTAAIARPNFIAYDIAALPAAAPTIARKLFGLPLLTWTVRTEAERQKAEHWADAVIFEAIRP